MNAAIYLGLLFYLSVSLPLTPTLLQRPLQHLLQQLPYLKMRLSPSRDVDAIYFCPHNINATISSSSSE